MKRIIYSVNNNKLWPGIAERLSNDYEWQPMYWVAPPSQKEQITNIFPDSIFHSVYDAHSSIPAKEFDNKINHPLDDEIYRSYRPYKSNALKMMDRMDMDNSFTYDERVRNYNRLLSYWLMVVDEIKPDLAIFSDSPHNVGQYLLYAVCVENTVETVIFTSSPVPEFVFPRSHTHTMPDNLRETYGRYIENDVPPNISDMSKKAINNIKTTQTVENSSDKNNLYSELNRVLDKISNLRMLPQYFKMLFSEKRTHRKKNNSLPENTRLLEYQDIIYKRKSNIAQRKLKKKYDSLSEVPKYDRKYVYFPLHLQPERATNPDGGVYSDQYLVANLLSESIPDDWNVYIKEHPLQFSSSNLGEQGRSIYDYDDFNDLKNIKLMDIDSSQMELIDNATAVATVTGTAGWEAINRGIPAIVFGNASYRLCTGVYHVKTKSELESALNSIQNGVEINEADILRFVHAVEQFGSRVPMYQSDRMNFDSPGAIDRYVDCIVSFVED